MAQNKFKLPKLDTSNLTEPSTQNTEHPQTSYYTTRGATDEYVIQGIQERGPDQIDQEQQKKKKKRKNKKKKQADNKPKQVTALKENLPQHELYADSDQSEDEGIADYKIGGYHPVHIGEVLINRYVVLQKIGWGHFSTVWLAKDNLYDSFVALKVQKSASHYMEAAYDEVEILDVVSRNAFDVNWVADVKKYKNQQDYCIEDCHTVQLLNSFIHCSTNGSHFVMVFEILGVNLLEIMKRYDYKGIPIPIVRRMAKQVLIGLDYLHRKCRVIHTDLKPENVVVNLTQQELQEIVSRGQLSSLNKLQKNSEVEQLIKPKNALTKAQKKKLKKKMKKQQQQNALKDSDINSEQFLSDEEMPRSHSLPNQTCDLQNEGTWQFVLQRDFPQEISNYFHLKKQKLTNREPKIQQPNMHKRGPLADENIKLKICDLGNGCWLHHHFTTKIQTRQYRSPEVMLGIDYDSSADLWSFACMIFELITGDFLFDPRKGESDDQGQPKYKKTDDHLAQMIEMLGAIPKNFAMSAKNFDRFFKKDPETGQFVFARIGGLNHLSLEQLLTDKYHFKLNEASQLADFLMKILKWFPSDRASAQQMLNHPWLTMKDDYNTKMSDLEFQKLQLRRNLEEKNEDVGYLVQTFQELNYGDDELNSDYSESRSISLEARSTSSDQEEFNLNISFSGGYMPNTDLSRVDKGVGNQQFKIFI